MLSSSYCSIWFIVDLLRHGSFCRLIATFYLCGAIQIGKGNSIGERYQIMVVNMLKNWNRRYSIHCSTKFLGFMPIYYAINPDIVSSFVEYILILHDMFVPRVSHVMWCMALQEK